MNKWEYQQKDKNDTNELNRNSGAEKYSKSILKNLLEGYKTGLKKQKKESANLNTSHW